MKPADFWIQQYQLQPHPEGGHYAEMYRSTGMIDQNALPTHFKGDRAYCTGIYFLLEQGQISAFHRILSDELWHFYAGESLEIYVLDPRYKTKYTIKLGNNPENGEVFQAVVPAGAWFASRPMSNSAYSLVGCTVAPGFDFEDFEMADRKLLGREFPAHIDLITELTYS
ncbi:cupin domain-containing protein [Dyadobacter jejuensis]|nr:cupin domain-containing protein [Dyadobacter jejuensis]